MTCDAEFERKRTALAAMRNIGLKSAGWMIEIGVDTPERLAEFGPVETYRRLKAAYPRQISICALWALEGALRDLPHAHLGAGDKAALKAALEMQKGICA